MGAAATVNELPDDLPSVIDGMLFPNLQDLESLNIYSREHHHGDDPGNATICVSTEELARFVHATLEITGCL